MYLRFSLCAQYWAEMLEFIPDEDLSIIRKFLYLHLLEYLKFFVTTEVVKRAFMEKLIVCK